MLCGHIEQHIRLSSGPRLTNWCYGKACHLPIEKCLLDLNELEEFRFQAYENSKLYKEKTKLWQDKRILNRSFEPEQLVLLFNSRLSFFLES